MVNWWLRKKTRISTSYREFFKNIVTRISEEIDICYKIPEVAQIGETMKEFASLQEDYLVEFIPIGGFSNRLITRHHSDRYVHVSADFYTQIRAKDGTEISNEKKIKVFYNLMAESQQVEREEHLDGLIFPAKIGAEDLLTLFVTMDPKAKQLSFTTRLFSLYTRCCPKYLKISQIFRSWAHWMGLRKTFDDDGVSGAIFDYLALYFMQQQEMVPVLNEDVFGCPMEEFLSKPGEEQLGFVRPLFEQQQREVPKIHRLWQCLICFYGCAFNRQEVVQIVSKERIFKENNGRRHIRVLDPFLNTNIAQLRMENLAHLENCFFLGAADFLVLKSADGKEESLRFTSCGGHHVKNNQQRSRGYSFILYESKNHRRGQFSALKIKYGHGVNSWNNHILREPAPRCSYCRDEAHSWRECDFLKLSAATKEIVEGLADRMTALCFRWFEDQRLTDEEITAAQRFISELAHKFNNATGHNIQFLPFGSLMSGFGAKGCDLDLCVHFADDNLDERLRQNILHMICEFCIEQKDFVEIRLVARAKVPILYFRHQLNGVEFHGDISSSNTLALHNTELLRTYTQMDDRVAPLVLAVKKWFKVCGLNNAPSGTLSSYAITILVLHFLQHTYPPILTCLQDETHYRLPESELVDSWDVRFAKLDSVCLVPPSEPNDSSVGQLFLLFFDYFDEFDWKTEVVQIRRADLHLLKIDKLWGRSWMAVEDPFELSHNLTAGVRTLTFGYILKCINKVRHDFRDPGSPVCTSEFVFDHFAHLIPKKPAQHPERRERDKKVSITEAAERLICNVNGI